MRTFNSWFVYLLLSRGLAFLPLTSAAPKEEIVVDDRPEGVANGFGDSELLNGQIISGEILLVNVLTGFQRSVVKPSDNGERQAWGLEYAPKFGAIIVAGGGPSFGGGKAEVYVYSSLSGQLMATCEPISPSSFGGFMNDVTVIGDKAYITDSLNDSVMTLEIQAAMKGDCEVSSIALPPAAFDSVDAADFGANGVAGYEDGILVSQELEGSVWYVNIANPSMNQQVLANGSVQGADGLIMDGNTLYVTSNVDDEIAVFELTTVAGTGLIQAEAKGCYSSSNLEAPSTSAIVKSYIYSANSRFFNFPDITDPLQPENTVIGIPLDDLGVCSVRAPL